LLYDEFDELYDWLETNLKSLNEAIRLKSSLTKTERKHENAAITAINPNAVNESPAVLFFKIPRKTKFTNVKKMLAMISVKLITVAGESG